MADNKLTILYSRLSREDENNSGESLSIENQKKILEDYAVEHGFTNIVHIFET
jgi:DNA invertase Pin-like site-specific DNA recombinase